MQYTIRGSPPPWTARCERGRARRGKDLNEAAVEALTEAVGLAGMAGRAARRRRRGGWPWLPDKAIESALADQDVVDEDLWQ